MMRFDYYVIVVYLDLNQEHDINFVCFYGVEIVELTKIQGFVNSVS